MLLELNEIRGKKQTLGDADINMYRQSLIEKN